MRKTIARLSAVFVAVSMAFGLSGQVWAQQGCIDPMPTYPDPGDPTQTIDPDDDNPYVISAPTVTEFDGNMTCDSIDGQFGGMIPDGVTGPSGMTFSSGTGTQFTVVSEIIDGKAIWDIVTLGNQPNDELFAVDTAITSGAQGGDGCLVTSGPDMNHGEAGYRKSNGGITVRDLYICADEEFDKLSLPPPPTAEPIQKCEVEPGQSVNLAGVTLTCPENPSMVPGWNQRTVVVATDTDESGNPVPDKGFQDESGEIAFSQFLCVCNPPDDDVPQCNPNLEAGDDPVSIGEYAGLEPCVVEQDTGSTESVDFTNPTCVTSGGRRRCY